MTMSFRRCLTNSHNYSSILVDLPHRLAHDIVSWGHEKLHDSVIFHNPDDPSFGREEESHVTLSYGIHSDNFRKVVSVFKGEREFQCTLGNIRTFRSNDFFDVLVIDVESSDLARLNQLIRSSLRVTDPYPSYVPHVTIAYLKKGMGDEFVGDSTFAGQKFTVAEVIFSSKAGVKTFIKLGEK